MIETDFYTFILHPFKPIETRDNPIVKPIKNRKEFRLWLSKMIDEDLDPDSDQDQSSNDFSRVIKFSRPSLTDADAQERKRKRNQGNDQSRTDDFRAQ